jgi:ParB family transcriptional regulator, chromosome partitioning protein
MTEQVVQQLKVADLVPSPFNPRKDFSKDSLADLADSIKAQGVLSPLLVRTIVAGDEYEIVAGERRWRAAKVAGIGTVPCIVQEMGDEKARELQIIENLQRQDITALEEAGGFQALLKLRGDSVALADNSTPNLPDKKAAQTKVTVKDLAERVGKSVEYVYARLKLLGLAAPVQKALAAAKIEPSHAVELAPLKTEAQIETLSWIKGQKEYGNGATVQQIREHIKYTHGPKPEPPTISAKEKARRARELAPHKKRQAAYDRQNAMRESDRAHKVLVNRRAVAALWPKLKAANAKGRAQLLDVVLENDARSSHDYIARAELVAEGKALPEGYVPAGKAQARFSKRPFGERLGLLILAEVIDRSGYGIRDAFADWVFAWAKIDRKAIERDLRKQEAAAAKAKVQTSAKPAKPAKQGSRSTASGAREIRKPRAAKKAKAKKAA